MDSTSFPHAGEQEEIGQLRLELQKANKRADAIQREAQTQLSEARRAEQLAKMLDEKPDMFPKSLQLEMHKFRAPGAPTKANTARAVQVKKPSKSDE